MTLSCNTWGVRSLLCSTFFNMEVECNLVSAWINPAIATIVPLVKEENFTMLMKILASRSPKLSSLWLGAMLVGMTKPILKYANWTDNTWAQRSPLGLELNSHSLPGNQVPVMGSPFGGRVIAYYSWLAMRSTLDCQSTRGSSSGKHDYLLRSSKYKYIPLAAPFPELSVLGLRSKKWRNAERRGHDPCIWKNYSNYAQMERCSPSTL